MKVATLLVLFVMACSLLTKAAEITAKVVAVIDGNTIEIIGADNYRQRLRLAHIDCPELEQEFGAEAKKYLEKLVLQKEVTVTILGRDRQGRGLAIVMIGDVDARIKLLKEGLAWTEEKNPATDLEPYRTWAQQKGKGLWKQEKPVPPWVYRRQQSMSQPKSS